MVRERGGVKGAVELMLELFMIYENYSKHSKHRMQRQRSCYIRHEGMGGVVEGEGGGTAEERDRGGFEKAW